MSETTTKKLKHPLKQYDCGDCKFNWCCGTLCACLPGLPPPSPERLAEVLAAQATWRAGRANR